MTIKETRAEILRGINARLIHGDGKDISKETGYSPRYVYKVLDINEAAYNEKIIAAALKIIRKRERFEKQATEQLADN